MSWAAIIAILIEVLKQRAEAGWPLLKALLERWGVKIQETADNEGELVVGAAPDEVKNQIVNWLSLQREKAGPVAKIMWSVVIKAVPLVADQIWDNLFQKNLVAQPLSHFTPVAFAAGPGDESVLFEGFTEDQVKEVTEPCSEEVIP